jgi:hypothetical protein
MGFYRTLISSIPAHISENLLFFRCPLHFILASTRNFQLGTVLSLLFTFDFALLYGFSPQLSSSYPSLNGKQPYLPLQQKSESLSICFRLYLSYLLCTFFSQHSALCTQRLLSVYLVARLAALRHKTTFFRHKIRRCFPCCRRFNHFCQRRRCRHNKNQLLSLHLFLRILIFVFTLHFQFCTLYFHLLFD